MNNSNACFCSGPQNGEPLCPCQMRAQEVFKKNNRWVIPEKDLGPVLPTHPYIPVIPPLPNYPGRDTVAICGECGLELKPIMMYCCPKPNCPCGLGGVMC